MTHDKSICEFCQAVATMDKIAAEANDVPEFGVPVYDRAIQDVIDAAENAADVLRCWAADRESADEHQA